MPPTLAESPPTRAGIRRGGGLAAHWDQDAAFEVSVWL
jgi:hypothetical protein